MFETQVQLCVGKIVLLLLRLMWPRLLLLQFTAVAVALPVAILVQKHMQELRTFSRGEAPARTMLE